MKRSERQTTVIERVPHSILREDNPRAEKARSVRAMLWAMQLHPKPTDEAESVEGWTKDDLIKSLGKIFSSLDYADALSVWLVACTLDGDNDNG